MFPDIIPSIIGAYLFAISAGITASPGVRSDSSVSLFPVPGTEKIPSAYFGGINGLVDGFGALIAAPPAAFAVAEAAGEP